MRFLSAICRRAYHAKRDALLSGSTLRIDFSALPRAKGANTNRRKQMRYPLRASVVYRWRDSDGMRRSGRGWTQDVSEEGVLVCSEDCPAVGELLDLALRVPTLRTPVPAPALRMDMKAKVIRILSEAGEGKNLGFAARRRDGARALESKSERPTLPYRALALGLRAN